MAPRNSAFDAVLEEMIAAQRTKVRRLAREIDPRLTDEDLLNPFDFPQLYQSPSFNYEDGILAGLLSAQMALRAHLPRASVEADDVNPHGL